MTNKKFQELTTLVCVMTSLSLAPTVMYGGADLDAKPGHPMIYLAGPLGFSIPGKEYQEKTLIPALEHFGYRIFDPWQSVDSKELSGLESMAPGPERVAAWRAFDRKIGVRNAEAIEKCDVVVAVLDGSDVDSGTAAEIGFAAARNKPIVGYRSDFRLASDNEGSVVNLQVEHFIVTSGGAIAHSLTDVHQALSRAIADSNRHDKPAPDDSSAEPSRRMPESNEGATANTDALDVVKFFSGMFTIILALALGEAFKQFVSDKAEKLQDRTMHWNRLPTLIIFLVTIIPFFEGMNRLFEVKYIHAASLRAVYPASLIVDSAAFMIESILFFVMSRALSPTQIGRVIVTLFFLFATDWARDLAEVLHTPYTHGPWFWQNLAALAVLGVALLWYQMSKTRFYRSDENDGFNNSLATVCLCVLATLAITRTLVDYYTTWNFYFPHTLD